MEPSVPHQQHEVRVEGVTAKKRHRSNVPHAGLSRARLVYVLHQIYLKEIE